MNTQICKQFLSHSVFAKLINEGIPLKEVVKECNNILYINELQEYFKYNFSSEIISSCINDFNLDINDINTNFLNFLQWKTYTIEKFRILEQFNFNFLIATNIYSIPRMNKECIDFVIERNYSFLDSIIKMTSNSYMNIDTFNYLLNYYIDEISDKIMMNEKDVTFFILTEVVKISNVKYSYKYIIRNMYQIYIYYQFIINYPPFDISLNDLLSILLVFRIKYQVIDETLDLLIENGAEINYEFCKKYNDSKLDHLPEDLQKYYLISLFNHKKYINSVLNNEKID